uniref:Syndecan n=1 Tax=Cyprinus carpio TaxID=7962 RepID=A0A8C1XYZ8_CYPCA
LHNVLVSGQSPNSTDDIYLDDQQSGDYPLDDDDFTSGSGSGKDCLYQSKKPQVTVEATSSQSAVPLHEVPLESILKRTEVLAAVIAGGVIGFLFAIFLILLLVYRMRKKDEGSYDLGERKPPSSAYQKAPSKEFYA